MAKVKAEYWDPGQCLELVDGPTRLPVSAGRQQHHKSFSTSATMNGSYYAVLAISSSVAVSQEEKDLKLEQIEWVANGKHK